MRKHKGDIIFGLALALACVLFAFKTELLKPDLGAVLAASEELTVRAVPVPLNTENPAQNTVGALRYVAGWALTSDHDRFGGLSGLVIGPDRQLAAISDQGDWLTATFDPHTTSVLHHARLHPFEARMPEDSKEGYDAESLIRMGDRFLVSFEQKHRLVVASPDGENSPWANGRFIDFRSIADNNGMEAITWTENGDLLAFIERGTDTSGRLPVWLVGGAGAERLYFRPPVNYAPTDAALLPNGDVLVLARFFSLSEGVAVKLLRIKAADIAPGATMVGEELASLAPPLTVDNMEGLDVAAQQDGSVLIYMVSDDNFRSAQRTLLLVFALNDAG